MIGHTWKPGDVAALSNPDRIAVVDFDGCFVFGRGRYDHALPDSMSAESARPLLVVDLSPHEVMRAAEALRDSSGMVAEFVAVKLEKAIRGVYGPAEPTGFAAVVLDVEGRRWIRDGMEDDGGPWFYGPPPRGMGWERRQYDAIAVVEVLSQGVTG